MSVCTGGDGNKSLAQGFACLTGLTGCWGYCIRDGGAILIGHRGCGALIQEGSPLVFVASVLLGCAWCWSSVYAALASPIFALSFKKWCRGDRSHASLDPVARQRPVVASTMEVLGAGVAPYGAAGIEVVDASPRLTDSAGSLL
jgi:hypothetical protein